MKRNTLTKDELDFLRANFRKLTNAEQLKHLNANRSEAMQIRITMFRKLKAKHNLLKYTMPDWSEHKLNYLKDHYAFMGNVEIAEILGLKEKQVEKKMQLLGLKRTPEMLKSIFDRNKKSGRLAVANKKRWEKTGVHQEGARIIRKQHDGVLNEYIKINGLFTPYARYAYELAFGILPKNYIVLHHDCNRLNNELNNLYALPRTGLKAALRARYAQHDFKNLMLYKQGAKPVAAPTVTKPLTPCGIPVRIDNKTVVYVRPGTNVEQLKARMAERMMAV